MNSPKAVVTVSLLWSFLLLAVSRQWLGDVRTYITQATHG